MRRLKVSLALLIASGSWGCGDGDRPSEGPSTASDDTEQAVYGIKGYIRQNGVLSPVEFSPLKRHDQSANTGTGSQSLAEVALASAGPVMAKYKNDSLPDETWQSFATSSGDDSVLAFHALNSCQHEHPMPSLAMAEDGISIIGSPWNSMPGFANYGSWYHFTRGRNGGDPAFSFDTCDQQLYAQEILLCAAGKLGALADAVDVVRWDAVNDYVTPRPGGPNGPYSLEFPPQSSEDRFVARDLALNMLAHLARLDAEVPVEDGQLTCDDRWSLISEDETLYDAWGDSMFQVDGTGTAYLSPDGEAVTVDATNAQELAERRVAYHAHLLRAAARLVREVVQKSVSEDMAGAEKRRAAAGDPASGLQRMWGVAGEVGGGYNSIAHALKTLYGRVELGVWPESAPGVFQFDRPEVEGDSHFDRRCGGYQAFFSPVGPADFAEEPVQNGSGETPGWSSGTRSLVHALGPSAGALWADVPPGSAAQALAASAIERSGIVLPSDVLADSPLDSALMGAVTDQLVLGQAIAAGYEEEELAEYEATSAGVAARQAAESLTPEDVVFGLRRNSRTVRLSYDLAPEATLGEIGATLVDAGLTLRNDTAAPDADGVVDALESVAQVVLGGLNGVRADLAVRGSARTLGARAAAECPWIANDFGYTVAPQMGAFQTPFGTARVLMDSLIRKRNWLENAGAEQTSVFETASTGIAEIASWGPGLVARMAPQAPGEKLFELYGLVPADYGYGTIDELSPNIVVAYGPPWVAQCIAGLRSRCPSAAELGSRMVPRVGSGDDVGEADGFLPYDGYYWLSLRTTSFFPHVDFGVGATQHYYVIIRGADGGAGRIVATFDPRDEIVFDFYSPLRDELADQVFGMKAPSVIPKMCRESNAAGISGKYCLPGVSRDFFVPLANELTSESGGAVEDSWKHYLTLAEQAASRTDELGRQIIEVGLQRDLRREAAQEELAAICGSFTAADGITVTDGHVSPSDEDSEINQCLQTDTHDVVLLGQNSFEGGSPEDNVRALFCDGTAPPAFCDRPEGSLSVGFLGLPPLEDAAPSGNSDCATITEALHAHAGSARSWDVANLTEAVYGDDASPVGLQLAAMRVRLVLNQDPDKWVLAVGSAPLLERKPLEEIEELRVDNPTEPGGSVGDSLLAGVRVYPTCKMLGSGWDCDPADYFTESGQEYDVGGGPPCCDGVAARFDRAYGTQGVSPLSDDALDDLGHRLESAVWHLGALAGQLPAGALTMPVPVANFDGPGGHLERAWAPALYATGRFVQTAGGATYSIDAASSPEVTTVDTQYLANLHALPVDFAASRRGLGPDWSEAVFDVADDAADGTYLVVPDAKSPEIRFNAHMVNADGQRVNRESMTNWIASAIAGLGGEMTNCAASGERGPLRAMQSLSGLDLADGDAVGSFRHVCAPGAQGLIRDNRYGGYHDVSADTELVLIDKWLVDHGKRPFSVYLPGGDDKKTSAVVSNWPFSADLTDVAACNPINQPWVSLACAGYTGSHDTSADIGLFGGRVRYYAPRVLSARYCPPGDRVELFLNRSVDDECQAQDALADALLLGCLARQNAAVGRVDHAPQAINDLDDLEYFEAWLTAVAAESNRIAELTFIEDVPKVAVSDFAQSLVGTGAVGRGTLGQHQLAMGTAFRGINTGWNHLGSSLRQLQGAVRLLRMELEGIELEGEQDRLGIAFQKMEQYRQIALAVISAADAAGRMSATWGTSALVGDGARVASGLVNIYVSYQQLDNLNEQQRVSYEMTQNAVDQAIQRFDAQVEGLYTGFQDSVTMIQDSHAQVLSALNGDRSARNEAAFEAAKASGADFAEVEGEVVAVPVNTVLRRQYDILQRRYERSLAGAKQLAYMARLAIEQRIGVRMNDLNVGIGALEAPSLWADDLCSLQGVDYEALRERDPESSDSDEEIQIDEFADGYIGDYVQKLKEFVEFYNIDAPFQQANDLVVVSLRDDVLGSAGQCMRESRNLLFFSDQLWHGAASEAEQTEESVDISVGGWRRAECVVGDDFCLDASLPQTVQNGDWRVAEMDPPGGVGGVTWLRNRLGTEVRAADSAIFEDELGSVDSVETKAPDDGVYQSATLRSATDYQLSWWDRGIDPQTGEPAATSVTPYQVLVYSSDWTVVASETLEPARNATESEEGWSERRSTVFTAFESGTYHVVFRASLPGVTTGSVAIANVQLAELESADMSVAYESTGASRMVVSGGCGKGNPEMMRSAFEYRCEEGRCFYEMRNTFDLGIIADGASSPIANRVAVGNFNYRNVSTALNIVGTGVLDCSDGTESCYGNGLVQYDLEHSAYSVGLEDYGGDSWCFNFERAGIRGAKALATERYLTVPMSSADQALIGDEAFSKRELFGRPLSGQYKLRLYDTPYLQWDRIQDIQMAVRYRYWSRVDRAQ